jgi:hypothetical protein
MIQTIQSEVEQLIEPDLAIVRVKYTLHHSPEDEYPSLSLSKLVQVRRLPEPNTVYPLVWGQWGGFWPVSLSIADAAVDYFLPMVTSKEVIIRQELNQGTVLYMLANGNLGKIKLRAVASDQTEVTIYPPPKSKRVDLSPQEVLDFYCEALVIHNQIISDLFDWYHQEHDRLTGSVVSSPHTRRGRKGGRPRNTDDEWAWGQIHVHHRDPKEVRAEWEERIGQRFDDLADLEGTWRRVKRLNRRKPD